MVFGGSNSGGTGTVPLSNLNGVNGFKLDGEASPNAAGISTAGVGDINGDGYVDILIGASNYANKTGRSYVVFGGSDIGNEGVIPLLNLNGVNGFKLDGEASNDQSGFSVNSAGDMNGDGYPDLLIGTPYHLNIGRSYVIFGGSTVGSPGTIALSNLNGINGFKLDGEASNDASGDSVSLAGDINSDGIEDILIGAPDNNGTGASYVIFGDMPPLLINNELSINQNETILLNSSHLLAIDANHNPDQLFFTVSNLTHGRFLLDNSSQPVMLFSQQQINDGRVLFQQDGNMTAPSYQIMVNTTGLAFIPAQSAAVDFDARPLLLNNTLSLNQGDTIVLTGQALSADHPGATDNPALRFDITNLEHGRFSPVDAPSNEIFSFYQQNITDRRIQFTHDNSTQPRAITFQSRMVVRPHCRRPPTSCLIHPSYSRIS